MENGKIYIEKRNKAIQTEIYKGMKIEYNIYGMGDYVVQSRGQDYIFRSKKSAMDFIDRGCI